MRNANDLFERGPESVIEWFADETSEIAAEPMRVKELADVCWTRANSLVKTSTPEAARWARAALAGYELLTHCDQPLVAESASESAALLRAWKLLASGAPAI